MEGIEKFGDELGQTQPSLSSSLDTSSTLAPPQKTGKQVSYSLASQNFNPQIGFQVFLMTLKTILLVFQKGNICATV